MNVSLYIAKRYLFSKSSNNAINFITIIAAIGVIIGSASLFIVLSGFAGLKEFSLQFSTIVDPDLKAVTAQGKSFTITESQWNEIDDLDGVISYSKVIEERAILRFDDKTLIVNLKGVDENYPQATTDSILAQGQWFVHDTDQIVAGWGVAMALGFSVFDFGKTINISVPKPGKGQVSSFNAAFRSIKATNAGLFIFNENLDNSLVYANLETVKHLLNYKDNQLSAIEFQLKDLDNLDVVKQQLDTILGDAVIIKNRAQLNDALYKMLNTENLVVYLIFTLVLVIALFNVIGSIIMMILDKKKKLNSLFNLGVTLKNRRRVFFLQGSLMTVLGGALGVLLGFVIIWFQSEFGLIDIVPHIPYPVSILPINFLVVFATISILGILASKIASARISKQLISEF